MGSAKTTNGSAAVAEMGVESQNLMRWGGIKVQGPDSSSFKVCGHYCGPGWCDNAWMHEGNCHPHVPPSGCSDACCKVHDVCCGDGAHGRSNPTAFDQCNTVLVQCLTQCSGDTSCHNGMLPVPPSLIQDGMSIVEDWCCGTPCTADMLLQAFSRANASSASTIEGYSQTDQAEALMSELHP